MELVDMFSEVMIPARKKKTRMRYRVAVIGGGSWATAIVKILSANLQERYSLKPVHTLDEIMLLHERFPEQIRLFVAKEDCETIGGCVLYLTNQVVHSQYIAANPRGRELHALDGLFEQVISLSFCNHRFFDFYC